MLAWLVIFVLVVLMLANTGAHPLAIVLVLGAVFVGFWVVVFRMLIGFGRWLMGDPHPRFNLPDRPHSGPYASHPASSRSWGQARPINGDSRVPMMRVHALFAGKATADDVLKAARAGEPATAELQRRLFYAQLYIGLFNEAIGNETEARQHITKAAHEYGGADYMSDVARVHLKLRETKKNSP